MSEQATSAAPARRWRYFIAPWFFPIFLAGVAVVEEQRGSMPRYLGWVISPLFLASYGILLFPRKVSRRDAVLFGMLLPFFIWVVAVIVMMRLFSHANAA